MDDNSSNRMHSCSDVASNNGKADSAKKKNSPRTPPDDRVNNPLAAPSPELQHHIIDETNRVGEGNQLPSTDHHSAAAVLPPSANARTAGAGLADHSLQSASRRRVTACGSSRNTASASNSALATDTALLSEPSTDVAPKSLHSNGGRESVTGRQKISRKLISSTSHLLAKVDKPSTSNSNNTAALSDSNSQKQEVAVLPQEEANGNTDNESRRRTGGADASRPSKSRSKGGEGSYGPFSFLVGLLQSYDTPNANDAGTHISSYPSVMRAPGQVEVEKLSATESAPYESQNVKKLRAHNRCCTIFIVVFAFVIALAGGLAVGFANQHFSQENSKRSLVIKNRIILNSSLASLHHGQDALTERGSNLFAFVQSSIAGKNLTTAEDMREALFPDFMKAWSTWLSSSDEVHAYSIFVPFCDESMIGTPSCSMMTLMVVCSPTYLKYCYYIRNSKDGTKWELYNINPDVGYENATFFALADVNITFHANQTGGKQFFLDPFDSPYLYDGAASLSLRTQRYLLNGQLAICDTSSYMQSWFDTFAATLQSAEDSYSMLFTNTGEVLAYKEGLRAESNCSSSNKNGPNCKHSPMIARMVDHFIEEMPISILYDDVTSNGAFTSTDNVNNYLTAYQDFLRFRTSYGKPNTIYFAAYGTPINTSIGTEGVVQIVVCVVVIVLCVLILGLVAATAVNQMQKVIELVSRLATHASTYDTENMEKVLQRNAASMQQRYWGAVLSSDIIGEEFNRILENLKAYRPFLPPSLLMQGSVPYEDDTIISVVADDEAVEEHHGDVGDAHSAASVVTFSEVHESNRPSRRASYHMAQDEGNELAHPAPRKLSGSVPAPPGNDGGIIDVVSLTHEPSGASAGLGRDRRISTGNAGETSFADRGSNGGRFPQSLSTVPSAMNERLRKSGLRPVKGTIMIVELQALAIDMKDATDVINYFLSCILARAKAANGVVDVMDATTVVISFNCHYTVLRHQEKAVRCALNIRDDLSMSNFGFNIGIAITTGSLYVGTIGTETQRARVVSGESVVVARQLLSLTSIVNAVILVTDEVAHAAGGVACVPVDVIETYRPSTHSWVEYDVCAVVGPTMSSMTPSYTVAKKLFKLIRGRHLEAAIAAMEAITKVSEGKKDAVDWCVERLFALLKHSPGLVKSGYKRRAVIWDLPEGEDAISNHISNALDRARSCTAAAASVADDPKTSDASGDSHVIPPPLTAAAVDSVPSVPSVVAHAAAARSGGYNSGELPFSMAMPSNVLVDETARAKEMINAVQRDSVTRRQRMCTMPEDFNDEDALFPVFMPPRGFDDKDDEYSEFPHIYGTTVNAQHSRQEDEEDEVIDTTVPEPQTETTTTPPCATTNAAGSDTAESAPAVNSLSHQRILLPTSVGTAPSTTHSGGPPVVTIKSSYSGTTTASSFRPAPHGGAAPSSYSSRRSNLADSQTGSGNGTEHGGGGGGLPLSNSSRLGNTAAQHIVSVNGQSFYRTNTLLGRGAFGEVFLALSESGGFVAMKAFPVDGFNAPQLIREVETLSKLRDDHIVAYDCCAVQGEQFFIMSEYMAAGSVRDLIKNLTTIPLPAVRKYGHDILYGLAYLHKNNWLHCDLKPDNVLLTPEGTCKLADFGAAALERSVGAGGVRGTPRFMAPEAVIGEWSPAADIYSFGLTMAMMLTGKQPWRAYTEPDHLFLVRLAGEVRYARENNTVCEMQPDLSLANVEDADLVQMIQRCCVFDPAQRPTVNELINMLL